MARRVLATSSAEVAKPKAKQGGDHDWRAQRVMILQMAAGAGAGAVTKTAVAPLERIKILFQVQDMNAATARKYTGIAQAARRVVAEDGFLGLYMGNGANVLRVIPVYALKFSFNDSFRDVVRGTDKGPLSWPKLMLAGTLAGLNQTMITYPLELVRTRLSLGAAMGIKYDGIVHCLTTVYRQEGFRALYKGMGPTLLTGSPYVGLQMSFYEVLRRSAPVDATGHTPLYWTIPAGAIAGLFAQTMTFPGDVVRKRMQANGAGGKPRLYTNSWDCTVKTVRGEGALALFKGLSTNVIRCLPGAGIQFAAYDSLKWLFGVSNQQLGK